MNNCSTVQNSCAEARAMRSKLATCSDCGSELKIIARIEDPAVIRKILDHLNEKAGRAGLLPECRAPPQIGLLV